VQKKIKKKSKELLYLAYHWVSPLIDPFKLLKGFKNYIWFLIDWIRYSRMEDAEAIRIIDSYPCLHDKTTTTPFDHHYFYQDIWAFQRIYESGIRHHVDVGSRIDFVGFLTTITKVTFIDIRLLEATLENFESKKGDILALPFGDNSVESLSCLHVAEHIGLGRYGDSLDPQGTKKAVKELSRVLAPGGNLYFSVPVGRPRLCFNAHRIHSPQQILDYFDGLDLVELSGIDDNGVFTRNIDINILRNCNYGCGLFWFKKPE
jgi:SAM-dependent methyltransferase